jgi:hypothetical protein
MKVIGNTVQYFHPTWIIGFLEVWGYLMYPGIALPFFSPVFDKCKKLWLLVDLLRRNPHWWFPTISFTYRLNLERIVLSNILYEVSNSDRSRRVRNICKTLMAYPLTCNGLHLITTQKIKLFITNVMRTKHMQFALSFYSNNWYA